MRFLGPVAAAFAALVLVSDSAPTVSAAAAGVRAPSQVMTPGEPLVPRTDGGREAVVPEAGQLVSATSTSDGRSTVVVISSGSVYHKTELSPLSTRYTPWIKAGTHVASKDEDGSLAVPAVGHLADGRLALVVRSAKGNMQVRWETVDEECRWSFWHRVPGTIASSPVVTSRPNGLLQAFAIGEHGDLVHTFQVEPADERAWTEWQSLGGELVGDVTLVSDEDELHVFARGRDGDVHHISKIWGKAVGPELAVKAEKKLWGSWATVPAPSGVRLVGRPQAGWDVEGVLNLFVLDSEHTTIAYQLGKVAEEKAEKEAEDSDEAAAAEDEDEDEAGQDADAQAVDKAAVAADEHNARVKADRAEEGDGEVREAAGKGDHVGKDKAKATTLLGAGKLAWSSPSEIANPKFLFTPTVSANADGRMTMFGLGLDHAVWLRWEVTRPDEALGKPFAEHAVADHVSWSSWHNVGGNFVSQPSVVRTGDGRLDVFAVQAKPHLPLFHMKQVDFNAGYSLWAETSTMAATKLVTEK